MKISHNVFQLPNVDVTLPCVRFLFRVFVSTTPVCMRRESFVYFRLVGFRLLHMSIHMPRTSVISTIAIINSGIVTVIFPPANFEFQVHP